MPDPILGSDAAARFARSRIVCVRQAGNHLRLATLQHGEHHVTIPQHTSLRIGTLSVIPADVATYFEIGRDQLLSLLFGYHPVRGQR